MRRPNTKDEWPNVWHSQGLTGILGKFEESGRANHQTPSVSDAYWPNVHSTRSDNAKFGASEHGAWVGSNVVHWENIVAPTSEGRHGIGKPTAASFCTTACTTVAPYGTKSHVPHEMELASGARLNTEISALGDRPVTLHSM